MTLTRKLIDTLNTGKPKTQLSRLIEHAAKNKILLHFLSRMNLKGPLREREEKRHVLIMNAAADVAERLNGLKYAFMKFAKPVAYVPADIDVLVMSEHVPFVIRRLKKKGYEPVLKEPYCITLNGRAIVDVYVHPCFINIPYMDGRKLLGFAEDTEFDNFEAKSLTPEAEVVVVVAHAVYKEQVFTLNDYYTIKGWLNGKTFQVAHETKTKPALAFTLSLVDSVERGEIETPYRISSLYAVAFLASKFVKDPLLRSSVFRAPLKLKDRRFGALVKSRLVRETY